MDWQQVEREDLLFVDGDFNWSEPPRRRRRITEAPIRATRRSAVLDYEPEHHGHYESEHHGRESDAEREPAPRAAHSWDQPTAANSRPAWDQPTAAHSHFDAMMEEWNANYGAGASVELEAAPERAFDLSDPGVQAPTQGARRTVVITGHGDDRYLPAPRQRRSSELRFHERAGFSPDRAGLWAVLLGIALVIGAIAH